MANVALNNDSQNAYAAKLAGEASKLGYNDTNWWSQTTPDTTSGSNNTTGSGSWGTYGQSGNTKGLAEGAQSQADRYHTQQVWKQLLIDAAQNANAFNAQETQWKNAWNALESGYTDAFNSYDAGRKRADQYYDTGLANLDALYGQARSVYDPYVQRGQAASNYLMGLDQNSYKDWMQGALSDAYFGQTGADSRLSQSDFAAQAKSGYGNWNDWQAARDASAGYNARGLGGSPMMAAAMLAGNKSAQDRQQQAFNNLMSDAGLKQQIANMGFNASTGQAGLYESQGNQHMGLYKTRAQDEQQWLAALMDMQKERGANRASMYGAYGNMAAAATMEDRRNAMSQFANHQNFTMNNINWNRDQQAADNTAKALADAQKQQALISGLFSMGGSLLGGGFGTSLGNSLFG